MAKRKTVPAFTPYEVRDPASVIGGRLLIVGTTFCGVRAVGYNRAYMPGSMLGVTERVIPDEQTAQYHEIHDENSSLQSIFSRIKEQMLTHGASRLAVQWVHDLEPFDEKELKIMAEKLKSKKTKPVGGGGKLAEGKAKKGNPEALAKARAARAENAGPDTRKIKVLKKPHGAREGTKRAELLDTIYSSKTVEEAVNAGVSKSDVSWAAREEYISLS